jgi:trehalose 6-phosphate phosphatase
MDVPDVAPERAALFLDFDGTLVEIAPRPEAVVVPPDLPRLLDRLSSRFGGALAIVSGRPIEEIAAMLPVPLAIAGDHGATLRRTGTDPVERLPLPTAPAAWREQAEALAARHPGAMVEPKAHGFVLHYRLAPDAGGPGRALLDGLVAKDADFVVMPARMAWEVKPAAISKATAVTELMARAPFAGRMPVFIGDDVTDEAGMAAARAAGGLGLRLQDVFGAPAGLRDWLVGLDMAR